MENIEETNVVIEEVIEDNVEPIVEKNKDFTNQLQKPKKPRTQKQIEALKKAQEKRKANIEARKQEKLNKATEQASKEVAGNVEMVNSFNTDDLIMKHQEELKKLALSKHTKELSKPKAIPKKKKQPKIVYQDDDSSSEEEIIYIPKSRKKKKKKKVIRHETSSSEEEEEEDQNNVPTYFQQPTRKLRYSDVFRFQ